MKITLHKNPILSKLEGLNLSNAVRSKTEVPKEKAREIERVFNEIFPHQKERDLFLSKIDWYRSEFKKKALLLTWAQGIQQRSQSGLFLDMRSFYSSQPAYIRLFCYFVEFRSHLFEPSEILGLNRHKFAPELNELVLKSGKSYKVPYCDTIEAAQNYLGERGET